MKKNIYCEDLNRHIPQNMHACMLALAGKVIFMVREPCLGPPCTTFLKLGYDREL